MTPRPCFTVTKLILFKCLIIITGLDCTAVTAVVSLATLSMLLILAFIHQKLAVHINKYFPKYVIAVLGGILGVVITLLIVFIGVRVRQHCKLQ